MMDNQVFILLVLWNFLPLNDARSLLRSAPQMCPIDQGNLLDVQLFVKGGNECFNLCEKKEDCNFFRYYVAKDGRPSQCYLFKTCGRNVVSATFDCQLNKENTIEVKPFVTTDDECKLLCQQNRKCGYYKYYDSSDEAKPEFCYLLQSLEECKDFCQASEDCRYYWWYPIERSEYPLYCYLFRQCAAKDDEPQVALVLGGRHPGHYFLAKEEHNDVIMRQDVCMLGVSQEVGLARAGAISQYVNQVVLFCGGRNEATGIHSDCLVYNPSKDKWKRHATMINARDEASSARVGTKVYVIGGVGDETVEYLDLSGYDIEADEAEYIKSREALEVSENQLLDDGDIQDLESELNELSVEKLQPEDETTDRNALATPDPNEEEPVINGSHGRLEWQLGPPLPEPRARACAVAVDDHTVIVVGGHDGNTSSVKSLSSGLKLNVGSGQWSPIANMEVARREHACLYIEFEETRGILVTGGLGVENDVLDSAEFYDILHNKWTQTSALKIGRTEHAMGLVYGIPTVIGGLSGSQFLSSIEQFDKSSASWNVPLQRDWRIINHSLNSPRYEMALASIPATKISACDVDVI